MQRKHNTEAIKSTLDAITRGDTIPIESEPADPDVYFVLKEVRETIQIRSLADKKTDARGFLRLEEDICIKTRTLLARFDSSTAWSGEIDEVGRQSIELHLNCALLVMQIEQPNLDETREDQEIRKAREHCKKAVESRLKDICDTDRLEQLYTIPSISV